MEGTGQCVAPSMKTDAEVCVALAQNHNEHNHNLITRRPLPLHF
jgi:hypothetical protein